MRLACCELVMNAREHDVESSRRPARIMSCAKIKNARSAKVLSSTLDAVALRADP